MNNTRVFQFHSGSAVGDAVTNSLFYIQDILQEYGIDSRIFVEHRDPRLADRLSLIGEFQPRHDDILIIHHSFGHDIMPFLDALKCRRLLLYHNVTPPRFFERDSFLRKYAMIGLSLLEDLRRFVEGSIADSEYNADELSKRGFENPVTIPLLRDFLPLRSRPFNPQYHYFEKPRYQLLFVGRISPNKGQKLLVEFIDSYRDAFDCPIYLTLVGHSAHGEGYATELRNIVEERGLQDRVTFAGHVSDEDLFGHYRAADAYVSFSEHEGFGVPLLEAMAFDVPVVAFNTSAIAGTLGSAGIKLESTRTNELGQVLSRLFSDKAYRREIVRGQRRRLMDFERSTVAAKLMDFLAPYLPEDVKPTRRQVAREEAPKKIHYIIEGPCETTYSLAITNRKLAIALDAEPDTSAMLIPMEGVPGYTLNPEGVRANPEIVPLLEAPSFNPDATIVSFRNMYPLRPAGMIGDYKIAGHSWEESEIPGSMSRLINRYLDGVAAPTDFVRRVYRNSGVRLPMAIYAHGIDHWAPLARAPRLASARFMFFHVSSGLARKGIEELILAYVAAFTSHDKVELIIKTHPNVTNVVEQWYHALCLGRPDAPLVTIIFDDLSVEQLGQLYAQADAVVLPSRGEGFNYPAAEALAHGLPLIVTGYSGHMDFCSPDNAYLIDYDFELNSSHLGVTQAMWVRARVDDLASKMREVFDQTAAGAISDKSHRAQQTARQMTWNSTTEKLKSFVENLSADKPHKQKLKIAWVSTWNTRCGIASYSELFVSNLPKKWVDIEIFCNHFEKIKPETYSVTQNWTDRSKDLDDVVKDAISKRVDAVVFQYNYGFHTLNDLAKAVKQLHKASIDTYVFFHKTEPAVCDSVLESIGDHRASFQLATRLVVHSVNDVNRLKSFGLVDNVVKLPHGARRPLDSDKATVRRLLSLGTADPMIGSYGFLVPPKGILELILAFSVLVKRYPSALLLLVNALYPAPVSKEEQQRCLAMIEQLGIGNNVVMLNEFLEDDESELLLQACDVIVLPYQFSGESASGAIRFGLSSLRPVLTTPLPIFDDVRDLVHQSKDITSMGLLSGIEEILNDGTLRANLFEKQSQWLDQHDWQSVGERFANMMIGLYQDTHDVSVRPAGSALRQHDRAKASPESDIPWMNRLGDEAFVRMAYHRALGRDPDSEGLVNCLEQLRGGGSRAALMTVLMSSEEARLLRRRREKEQGASHSSDNGVERIYFSDLAQGDDFLFIERLYTRLLNRPSDKDGFDYHTAYLRHGGSRAEVTRLFVSSEEFRRMDRPVEIVWTDTVAP